MVTHCDLLDKSFYFYLNICWLCWCQSPIHDKSSPNYYFLSIEESLQLKKRNNKNYSGNLHPQSAIQQRHWRPDKQKWQLLKYSLTPDLYYFCNSSMAKKSHYQFTHLLTCQLHLGLKCLCGLHHTFNTVGIKGVTHCCPIFIWN